MRLGLEFGLVLGLGLALGLGIGLECSLSSRYERIEPSLSADQLPIVSAELAELRTDVPGEPLVFTPPLVTTPPARGAINADWLGFGFRGGVAVGVAAVACPRLSATE